MDLWLVFLTLGGVFSLGLLADQFGRHSMVPRVTLLLLGGLAVGSAGLDLIPDEAYAWYDFLSVTALTMVAFLLGGELTRANLAAHGRTILAVSLSVVVVTWIMVAAGLWAMGTDPALAMIFGAIATATAPAATQDVIRQSGIRNGFTDTIGGIVAIDDAWGLLVFSLSLTFVHALNGAAGGEVLLDSAWEIGGALALGVVVGVPSSYLTGRITQGEPLQTEALAIVFLTAGLALWLDVSFLLAGMTAGAIVVNLARHHERSFHEIEHIQWPFMLLFFVLAGSSLEVDQLAAAGMLGFGYIGLRIVSRLIGGWVGARFGLAPPRERPWFGLALLPQAGVAVGMALVAAREFPAQAETILTITIAATVVFEILGPLATRWAIRRTA